MHRRLFEREMKRRMEGYTVLFYYKSRFFRWLALGLDRVLDAWAWFGFILGTYIQDFGLE
jgi:hypothetical protein